VWASDDSLTGVFSLHDQYFLSIKAAAVVPNHDRNVFFRLKHGDAKFY
jgi:hypothetical protein